MKFTTRILLSALLGYTIGFIVKRPGLGLLVGSIVGAIMPVDRYIANPLTYLFAGGLLFAAFNPGFFGVIVLLVLAPFLLSFNLFRPGQSSDRNWNIFDLMGEGSPTETMLALLAGFVQESPASREEQFRLVKRFIRQTSLGFSRETLWQEFRQRYESDLDIDTLAKQLQQQAPLDQQKYFLQIMVSLGKINGSLSESEKTYLRQVTEHLDLSEAAVEAIFDQPAGNRGTRGRGQRRRGYDRRRRRGSPGGSSVTDAYETLGVDPSASKKDVKKAYQRKVKEHHPDQYKGEDSDRADNAEEKMAEINEAYETIKKRW